MKSDSRRSFVKKSLAASIAASQPAIFSGILKAQGGGGGTTDPWGTTGLWGTTVADTTGMWDTTMFDGTTYYATTAPPQCSKIVAIAINFTSDATPPANRADKTKSGRRFDGTLTMTIRNCVTGEEEHPSWPVFSGGHISDDYAQENGGPDTCIPAGNFLTERDQSGGNVKGYEVNEGPGFNNGTIGNREHIEIHGPPANNPAVSEGCVVFTNINDWVDFRNRMNQINKSPCLGLNGCTGRTDIPTSVRYATGLNPEGNDGNPYLANLVAGKSIA